MPLMTYDEYQKTEHETPYAISLKSSSNFLYYFGERHSFNPKDEQWIEAKKIWLDFLKQTENTKRIVFIEGGKRPHEIDEEQSILKHGGMGLATYLAQQSKIDTYSPEPDEKYERGELGKEFSREQIQYYYFARVVHQWGRKQNPKPNFEDYITHYLEGDKKESGWSDFDFSLVNMTKIHNDIFQTVFNQNDADFFKSIVSPVVLKTMVNKVSRASSEIRDKFIVKEIQKYITKGYSIFAQYGCSHVVMQEPLIREIFNKPQNNWTEYYEITDKKLNDLRIKLDAIVSEENAENWWKPKLFERNTLPILPPELEVVEGVPTEDKNYNCFVYVLGLHKHAEIIGNKGWEFTKNLGPIFDEMIEKGLLKKVGAPTQGAVIVYRTQNGSISHVGLMENEDTIISKWSWGPLLKHPIFAVPADYGDIVEFHTLTPKAVDYVLSKQADD